MPWASTTWPERTPPSARATSETIAGWIGGVAMAAGDVSIPLQTAAATDARNVRIFIPEPRVSVLRGQALTEAVLAMHRCYRARACERFSLAITKCGRLEEFSDAGAAGAKLRV